MKLNPSHRKLIHTGQDGRETSIGHRLAEHPELKAMTDPRFGTPGATYVADCYWCRNSHAVYRGAGPGTQRLIDMLDGRIAGSGPLAQKLEVERMVGKLQKGGFFPKELNPAQASYFFVARALENGGTAEDIQHARQVHQTLGLMLKESDVGRVHAALTDLHDA